jgi:predicted cupin superfamily sugar epimerase
LAWTCPVEIIYGVGPGNLNSCCTGVSVEDPRRPLLFLLKRGFCGAVTLLSWYALVGVVIGEGFKFLKRPMVGAGDTFLGEFTRDREFVVIYVPVGFVPVGFPTMGMFL